MATDLQENLAEEIVKNIKRRKAGKKPKNKHELVISGGYSEITAQRHAKRTIEQIGVQKELKKRGFDSENAKRVVGEILDNTKTHPQIRLNAAKEIFAVQGDYAPEKHLVLEKKIIKLDV